MKIYHITHRAAWDQAQQAGMYRHESLASEGFIHASTAPQVAATGNRFYRGMAGLVILEIDSDRLQPDLRFETAHLPTGDEQFPHIYGPLNLEAVTSVRDFVPDEQGNFHFAA